MKPDTYVGVAGWVSDYHLALRVRNPLAAALLNLMINEAIEQFGLDKDRVWA